MCRPIKKVKIRDVPVRDVVTLPGGSIAKITAQHSAKLLVLVGFSEELGGSELLDLFDLGGLRSGGVDNYGDIFEDFALFHGGEELETVHARHIEIEEDIVGNGFFVM